MYVSYEAALEMSGLTSLTQRRAAHLLKFAKLSARHPVHGPRMFPLNQDIQDICNLRARENYQVNFSRGAAYFASTIPTAQSPLMQPQAPHKVAIYSTKNYNHHMVHLCSSQ